MKILYYSTAFYASHGGANHSKAFVSGALRNPIVKSIEVYPESNQMSNDFRISGWRKRLKESPILQVLFFFRRNQFHLPGLFKKIQISNPDVLHVRLDSNFLQLRKIRKRFPNLVISTEVNASPFDESFKNIFFRSIFRQWERKALCKSHLNFFVSDYLRHYIMANKLDLKRDWVVHNGVDINLFSRKNIKAQSNEVVLIYIGTLDWHKKIKNLLEAFSLVHKEIPKIKLVILGDGPSKGEVENWVISNHLGQEIRLLGWVPNEKVPDYLEKADIAIHHFAHGYMSPIKIFEYMAMGLPVIGPDTAAVREIFEDEVDILLTSGDSEDIANKIRKLIQSESLRLLIATSGQKKVINRFTWKKNVDFILDQINKV